MGDHDDAYEHPEDQQAEIRIHRTHLQCSPALTVSDTEMVTALRIFGQAVANVGEHGEILAAAKAAHAVTGVEAAG